MDREKWTGTLECEYPGNVLVTGEHTVYDMIKYDILVNVEAT